MIGPICNLMIDIWSIQSSPIPYLYSHNWCNLHYHDQSIHLLSPFAIILASICTILYSSSINPHPRCLHPGWTPISIPFPHLHDPQYLYLVHLFASTCDGPLCIDILFITIRWMAWIGFSMVSFINTQSILIPILMGTHPYSGSVRISGASHEHGTDLHHDSK